MLKAAVGAGALVFGLPLLLAVLVVIHPGDTSATGTGLDGAPTAYAGKDIPTDYLRWYTAAARTCPGLPWAILAGIGKTESDHGRSHAPGVQSGTNSAGAQGPMQFLAPTWAQYGVDADGDGSKNAYDPADAIYGAANYLCHSGAHDGTDAGIRRALFAYNHAGWYVDLVLKHATHYAVRVASGQGGVAVQAALRWLGTPYSWGGGGPNGPTYGSGRGAGTKGFDCSGLAQYAWAQAGIHLDRIAAAQYNNGPHVPRDQLRPGDLLFFATNPSKPATIHHVALYFGDGRMIHAPHTGDHVRISPFTGDPTREAEYAGATRPGANPDR
ncbi:NlpC/P60 family protein [Actinomadura scrupuli]|uniref:C40 family peptidase n=1 Tax=Actinomadura scrupuli TaxID=559629 RepID=UPI003D99D31D